MRVPVHLLLVTMSACGGGHQEAETPADEPEPSGGMLQVLEEGDPGSFGSGSGVGGDGSSGGPACGVGAGDCPASEYDDDLESVGECEMCCTGCQESDIGCVGAAHGEFGDCQDDCAHAPADDDLDACSDRCYDELEEFEDLCAAEVEECLLYCEEECEEPCPDYDY